VSRTDVADSAHLRFGPAWLTKALVRLGSDEHASLLILAALIGLAAGLTVTVFYRLVDLIQYLILRSAVRAPLPSFLLIPLGVAAGLVACRWLVRRGAQGSDGENVPDVMYRVTVRGGQMPGLPVIAKSLAAAVTIGTGGSVGAEGPVIVAGATVASRIGRFLRVSPNRVRTLVGCGAAAGLSAAFNAPIAGVLFGIEKILGAAGGLALAPFVVSSIIAAAVGRAIFGNHPVLTTAVDHGVPTVWGSLLYVVLGLACGGVSVLYSRGVWRMRDYFDEIPEGWKRVLLAVVIVGGLDVVFQANLWGRGHESLDLGMIAHHGAMFLFALTAAKIIATAFTLGAGGVGGVFAPSLFIGATLGGAIGTAAQALGAPSTSPGALALVGMAGLVSGATHAPLTAIMMVFEMTGDYGLILPVMLTAMLSFVVARRLHPESIYTEWLRRKGVSLTHGADGALLARVPVRECLNRDPATVPESAGLTAMVELTRSSRQTDFPVVDARGRLRGMVSQQAIRDALNHADGLGAIMIAADLADVQGDRLTPDDSLLTALRMLGRRDVSHLPVVSPIDPERLEGLVSRADLFAAYERHLTAESH